MSEDLKRCEGCLGRKTILGMGGMTVECPYCFGIGWQKINTPREFYRNELIEEDAIISTVKENLTVEPIVINSLGESIDEYIKSEIIPIINKPIDTLNPFHDLPKRGRPKKTA